MSFLFCVPRQLLQQSRLKLLAMRLLLIKAVAAMNACISMWLAGDAFNRASVHSVTVEIARSAICCMGRIVFQPWHSAFVACLRLAAGRALPP